MNTLSHFLIDPRQVHLFAAKHILRYLKGTFDYGLRYDADQKVNRQGYVHSDWANSDLDRNITLGCCFSMGSDVIS